MQVAEVQYHLGHYLVMAIPVVSAKPICFEFFQYAVCLGTVCTHCICMNVFTNAQVEFLVVCSAVVC